MRSSLWLKGSATLRTSRRSTLSPHSAVSRATRLLHRTGIVGQSQTAAPRNETHPTGSKKGQGFFNSSRFRIAADSSQALQKWPKQFIITSSSPHTTTYQDIVDQISSVFSTHEGTFEEELNPAVVILATPAFATWLEYAPFVSDVLRTIFSRTGYQKNGEPPKRVSALLAVVDGLPATEASAQGVKERREGFAILRGRHKQIIPGMFHGMLDENGQELPTLDVRKEPASINLSFWTPRAVDSERSFHECVDVSIPLANTVFKNGKASTLLATGWARTSVSEPFTLVHTYEKRSQTIRPKFAMTQRPQNLALPLRPLTPGRRIVSGMGNIVRQIEGADGEPQPASQELEKSVNAYLAARGLGKDISVWALVIPSEEELYKKRLSARQRRHIRNRYQILRSAEKVTEVLANDVISTLNWMYWPRMGAGLHRVLSGGGGWGIKAGLLSLDSETTFCESKSAENEFDFLNLSEGKQQLGIRNIAKPGSLIQFLIADDNANWTADPKEEEEEPKGTTPPPTDEPPHDMCIISCTRSTVDDLAPPPPSNADPSTTTTTTSPGLHLALNTFGAQSEAGFFLCTSRHDNAPDFPFMRTKVDVPYARFQQRMARLPSSTAAAAAVAGTRKKDAGLVAQRVAVP